MAATLQLRSPSLDGPAGSLSASDSEDEPQQATPCQQAAPCQLARSKTRGFLSALPRKRELVRQFTPSWFTVTMGTGSVAITIGAFPFHVEHLKDVGFAFWVLTCLLFATWSCLSIGRLLAFPRTIPKLFAHPNQSLFIGAIPMSFSTITNGIIAFLVPRLGQAAADVAHALFWVNLPGVLGSIVLIPFSMYTLHARRHAADSMTAVWLLPVVPACVAANTAGVVAAQMTDDVAAVSVIYMGVALLGIGFWLSIVILAAYYQRLVYHSLPAREVIISSFLPVGPMAMTAWAMLSLSTAVARHLIGHLSLADPAFTASHTEWLATITPTVQAMAGLAALFVWGFSCWWLLLAVAAVGSTLRQGIPFNLGWWGAVFPLGVWVGATVALGHMLRGKALLVIGAAGTVVHVAVWALVAFLTCQRAWTGSLIHAPCLASGGALPQQGLAAAAAAAVVERELSRSMGDKAPARQEGSSTRGADAAASRGGGAPDQLV